MSVKYPYSLVLIAIFFVITVELVSLIHYQRERRRQTIPMESGAPQPPPQPPQSRITDDSHKILDAVTGGMIA